MLKIRLVRGPARAGENHAPSIDYRLGCTVERFDDGDGFSVGAGAGQRGLADGRGVDGATAAQGRAVLLGFQQVNPFCGHIGHAAFVLRLLGGL
jgi:hypothetical protein